MKSAIFAGRSLTRGVTNALALEVSRMRASDGFNPFPLAFIAAAVAAGSVLVAVSAGSDVVEAGRVVMLASVVVFGAWAGWIDAHSHRIPDAVTIPMAIVICGVVITCTLLNGGWSMVGPAVFGAAALGGFYLAAATFGDLGLGDVKLAATLGTALACSSWMVLLWGGLLGLVLPLPHAALLRKSRGHIPLGPYMVAGAVATMTLDQVKPWILT